MTVRSNCSGEDLRGMFATATKWLEKNAQNINLLNVFPVPDGDTGTNMLLTMRATTEEAYRCSELTASAIAQAMARGALMGARGNSGVILSQIMRGFAQGMDGKDSFGGLDLASALAKASTQAYKGVSNPVEGTMLTVIREVAAAAGQKATVNGADILSVIEATVEVARESVANTPMLLDVLREAGVVDAGGQGIYVLLEGIQSYLRGDRIDEGDEQAYLVPSAPVMAQSNQDDPLYGYCTEFLLQGNHLNVDEIRQKYCTMGESVLVVGDSTTIRVHIHTFDPGSILSYGSTLGSLHKIKIDNMQDQHNEFIGTQETVLKDGVSIVAVVSGEGLTQVFKSIGATHIVSGGQTMNPSVQELLQAVDSAPTKKVIILPNNPNIMLTARQAQSISEKDVMVVGETIPQGIAALLAFQPEASDEDNFRTMIEAVSTVHTGEITTAVRSTQLHGVKIKQGQAIGFMDGEFVIAGDDRIEVFEKLLRETEPSEGTLITIFWGADSNRDEVDTIVKIINRKYPDSEVEVVEGGQPHYNYIISVE